MPVATIHVLAGHPREALKALLREVSLTYAEVLGSPIERNQVWIEEIDPALYNLGGEPADEVVARGERAAREIPLLRLVLLEGRPQRQVEDAIRELSAAVARALGGSPAQVRVEVRMVPPDHWGIGGVTASVKRRGEIEARKRKA